MAGLRTQQLSAKPPISVEGSPPLPSMSIHLGRTKTSPADSDEVVYLNCRPVDALNAWLKAAKIDKGSVFRVLIRRRLSTPSAAGGYYSTRVLTSLSTAARTYCAERLSSPSEWPVDYATDDKKDRKARRLTPDAAPDSGDE
jgi:hypothetical protein